MVVCPPLKGELEARQTTLTESSVDLVIQTRLDALIPITMKIACTGQYVKDAICYNLWFPAEPSQCLSTQFSSCKLLIQSHQKVQQYMHATLGWRAWLPESASHVCMKDLLQSCLENMHRVQRSHNSLTRNSQTPTCIQNFLPQDCREFLNSINASLGSKQRSVIM